MKRPGFLASQPFFDTGIIPPENQKYCKFGWLLKSPVTESFGLAEFGNSDWENWKVYTGVLENVEYFSIECIECDIDIQCGGGNNKCVEEGSVGFCNCADGKTGPFCTEDAPCDALVWTEGEGTESNGQGIGPHAGYGHDYWLPWSSTSFAEYPKLVYDRPVYSTQTPWYHPVHEFWWPLDLLIYTGRRWEFMWVDNNMSLSEFYDDAIGNQEQPFNAFWENLKAHAPKDTLRIYPAMISKPTDSYSPAGEMEWMYKTITGAVGNYGPDGYVYASTERYNCYDVDCTVQDVCGVGGTCNTNTSFYDSIHNDTFTVGTCDCKDGFVGWFCETSCENIENQDWWYMRESGIDVCIHQSFLQCEEFLVEVGLIPELNCSRTPQPTGATPTPTSDTPFPTSPSSLPPTYFQTTPTPPPTNGISASASAGITPPPTNSTTGRSVEWIVLPSNDDE